MIRRALIGGAAALVAPESLRAAEAEHEVALEATYTIDVLANLSGGARRDIRLMGMVDAVADVSEAATGVDGLSFHIELQLVHGGGFSDAAVGDAQVVSNIDAPSGLRPLEAYAALAFGEAREGMVKAGLIDLNGDFDVQEVGAFFINSSHGIGPDFSQSGLGGPSIFPTTASAVTAQWQAEGWTARLGLFDAVAGDPDHPRRTVVRFPGETGLLIVGEVDFDLTDAARLQLGGWTYTSRFDALDRFDAAGAPERLAGNRGIYGLVEGTLARAGESSLDGWLRIGAARRAINPIGVYVGGGFTYGSDRSRTGIAVGHARLGNPAVRAALAAGAAPDRAETAIELSHSRRIGDRLTLQPDLQYIVNPGWIPARRDAVVAGVRIQIALF